MGPTRGKYDMTLACEWERKQEKGPILQREVVSFTAQFCSKNFSKHALKAETI